MKKHQSPQLKSKNNENFRQITKLRVLQHNQHGYEEAILEEHKTKGICPAQRMSVCLHSHGKISIKYPRDETENRQLFDFKFDQYVAI